MRGPSIDRLLQHSGWVRALAGRLVKDPALADDLVQETWLSALQSEPTEVRSPRAWLARLLWYRLQEAQRREHRRAHHEALSQRESELDTTDEHVEGAEQQRLLEQAVLELREPYRTTVLMRYLQELAPGEIAAKLAIPEPTVHSRLARGLAQLRLRLETRRDERDRGRLLAFCARWIRGARRAVRPAQRRALAAGALFAGFAFLGVSLWLATSALAERGPDPGETRLARAAAAPDSPAERLLDAEPARSAAVEPEALPHEAPREAVAVPPPPLPARLRGRVLDCDGLGVGGAKVAVASPRNEAERALSAVSAPDGSFELARPAEALWLSVSDDEHVTVLEGRFDPRRADEPTLFVAPWMEVKGHVRDDRGVPIAEAEVFVDPGALNVGFDRELFFNRMVTLCARSDERGAFHLARVPKLPEMRLLARVAGRMSNPIEVNESYAGHMFIRLNRPGDARFLRGRVLDWLGRPVPGALVSAYPNCTVSDAQGGFAMLLWAQPQSDSLVGLARSGTAASLPLEHDAAGKVECGSFVELRLPQASQALEGRVLDSAGLPLSGALVWIADPTLVQQVAEGVLGVESLCADPAPSPWSRRVTDDAGRFALAGLFEREYRVRVADPRTLASTEVRVRPGAPLELCLAPDELPAPVRGRVLDARGQPVAGVEVRAYLDGPESSAGDGARPEELSTPPITTDAQGRFELPPCARAGTYLALESERILPARFELAALAAGALELTVSFPSFLGVRLDEPWSRADAFEVLDVAGAPATPFVVDQCKDHPSSRRGFVDGRSAIQTVPDTASTIVFLKQGREVGRIPVTQRAGELALWDW